MKLLSPEKRYLFPDDYMADPSVHVFNGKIYIYPSHDWECENIENDNGDQYVMKDMHVLTIDGNPMTGHVTDHGKALDIADIPWAGRQLWDCDCAEKDGKYYLYFPLKDKNDIFRIGGGERVTRTLKFQGGRRGYYTIDEVSLVASDLFFLSQLTADKKVKTETLCVSQAL